MHMLVAPQIHDWTGLGTERADWSACRYAYRHKRRIRREIWREQERDEGDYTCSCVSSSLRPSLAPQLMCALKPINHHAMYRCIRSYTHQVLLSACMTFTHNPEQAWPQSQNSRIHKLQTSFPPGQPSLSTPTCSYSTVPAVLASVCKHIPMICW